MTADIHALVGAYALDAVDDLERAAFERHLLECESCRAEADELRETAARLADGAWSVPPPRLRANVLAEIANTRQVGVPGPAAGAASLGRASAPRRLVLAAAAAVVVAAVGAGTAVYEVQDHRVRTERALAEAAQQREARIRSVLASPDLVVRDQPLASGGRVTVVTSRLADAGVIMLAAESAPGSGRVYQLWAIRSGTPASAGALSEGQSAVVQVVEGMATMSGVGVTVEPAPGSVTPTAPLDALVKLS